MRRRVHLPPDQVLREVRRPRAFVRGGSRDQRHRALGVTHTSAGGPAVPVAVRGGRRRRAREARSCARWWPGRAWPRRSARGAGPTASRSPTSAALTPRRQKIRLDRRRRLLLTVRVDPAKAQKWLPNSLLRVRGDTARVFFAWYARRRRSRPSRHFSFVRSASASSVATSFTNRRRKNENEKKKPAGTPTRSAAARTTRRPSCWTSRTSRPGSARTTARGCSWTRTGP